MRRPVTALVLALAGLVLAPLLITLELSALFLAGMVVAEPANSLIVKILFVTLVVLIGVAALALPLIATILGARARAAAKAMQATGTGPATAAVVIGAIVTVGVIIAQVYYLFMVVGTCSLEGC